MCYYLNLYYFPPINYILQLFNSRFNNVVINCNNIILHRSYINKINIISDIGILPMYIPLKKNKIKYYKDIVICYDFNWQLQHYKTILNYYAKSPYLQYYIDDINNIYSYKEKYLINFNIKIIDFILNILNIKYSIQSCNIDYENKSYINNPKYDILNKIPYYTQVFENKLGFINDPNISVLDLILSLGPESKNYFIKKKATICHSYSC